MASDGHKLITCVLPLGVAVPLARALKSEKGIVTAHVSNARGVGKLTPTADRRLGDHTEKHILSVVVDDEDADEAFALIYHEAGINQPHGGLMFMSRLKDYVPLVLPDLPEEEP